MSEFWGDLRFGFRLLRRSPVFALTAVLLLAAGIGANTLIFSFVNALLLRPLSVEHPEQLVRLIEMHPKNFATWDLPYLLYQRLGAGAELSEAFCQGDLEVGYANGAGTERIRVNAVSENFFSALGIQAQMGRVLTPEDDRSGAFVAVASYEFWQDRLGGSADVIGKTIQLNRQPFTIVGVLPRGINGVTVETSPEVRIPIHAEQVLARLGGFEYDPLLRFQIFGRLRPGASLEQAGVMIRQVIAQAQKEGLLLAFSRRNSRLQWESIARGVSLLRERFSRGLILLLGLTGLLLLMTCANVACLLLARAAARGNEIGIRFALGASRWRVVRQLFSESLAIALPGGLLGIFLSYAARPLLLAALPPVRDRTATLQPLAVHADIDGRVLAFAAVVSMLTALLFGLSPALRSARGGLSEWLHGGRAVTARFAGRNLLVTIQVAICVLLLLGAGLLVETFEKMQSMNAGFDQEHVAAFTVDPGLKGYRPEQAKRLSKQLLDRVRILPGVDAVAIASLGVMHGTGMKGTVNAAGKPVERNDFLNCSLNLVTPGYFAAMGIPILEGRDFRWTGDDTAKPKKVIVNAAFARRFFPGQDAIGKTYGAAGPDGLARPENEIVGIVGNAKYRSLREPVPPTAYSPVLHGFDSEFILHVRTRGPAQDILGLLERALHSLDPGLPLIEAHTLREEVETSLWQERLLAALSSLFGAFAALLAAIGLYGALDLAVKARTREIGVRMALGAEPVGLVWLLAKKILVVTGAGVAAGIGIELLLARWIRSVLYGVLPTDPTVFTWTVILAMVIATAAIAAPLWKALHIEPAAALRQE